MAEKSDRRDAVKTMAAAGGLLLLAGSASADQPEDSNTLAGEWFNRGKLDQPCAVFQYGRVLILINEKGDLATGQFTEANQFTVLKGWGKEVVGQVQDRGQVIGWKGGGNWKRR